MNTHSAVNSRSTQIVPGVALILIGLLVLAGQLFDTESWGDLIPAGLGVIFLVWGVVARQIGLLIPGGILSGIGAGAFLITGPFSQAEGEVQGAIFLLAFAGGWGLITLLSALTTDKPAWWALVPGGIMALIGAALLSGSTGQRLLNALNIGWPVVLIAIGLYLILWRKGLQK